MEKKRIEGYEGKYAISKDGRVWSCHDKIWMKSRPTINGYPLIILLKEGNRKGFLVSRLVAQTYIPNPKGLPQVNHKNGIKTDNRVENLEWISASENVRHGIRNGLMKNRKLPMISEKDVENIRSSYKFRDPVNSGKKLAEKYGVHFRLISVIINNKNWKAYI